LRFVFSIDLLEIAFGIALAIANRPHSRTLPVVLGTVRAVDC